MRIQNNARKQGNNTNIKIIVKISLVSDIFDLFINKPHYYKLWLKTKKEKEDLIVKLSNEGRTYREITNIARCSPNEIIRIRKKMDGENTDTSPEMKSKSICAQVFDLLEKEIPLPQIITKVDIDPDEAMRIENKYLHVLKMDKIVYLLKDQKDMVLTIDILEFLKENPHLLKLIKEAKDLQFMVCDLMVDREEIEHDIEVDKTILRMYDKMLEKKEKYSK